MADARDLSSALADLPSETDIGESAQKKIAWRLLPLFSLGYGAAIMDRTNVGLAALQMNRDLHFSASIFGFGAGLFSIGYALCEIPSNLALYRFGAPVACAHHAHLGIAGDGHVLVRPRHSSMPCALCWE